MAFTGSARKENPFLWLPPFLNHATPLATKTIAFSETYPNAGNVVTTLIIFGTGGCPLNSGAHTVFIVLAHEHHGDAPQLGDVERFEDLGKEKKELELAAVEISRASFKMSF